MTPLLLAGLVVVLGLALFGDWWPGRSCNEVQAKALVDGGATGATDTTGTTPAKHTARPLFVLVHGFKPDQARWQAMAEALQAHGRVLPVRYAAGPLSNADPQQVADGIGRAIAAANTDERPVVVVAHSMGALLARRAVLDGLLRQEAWADKVQRLVLLAGMNRGWTAEGQLPPDATVWLELQLRFGHWLANMIGRGQLLLDLQRGAPFVSNLRLQWMQTMHDLAPQGGQPQGAQLQPRQPETAQAPAAPTSRRGSLEVVQLLGDIDDFVQRTDNEDLLTTARGEFALLRVRGTGHGDILEFHRGSSDADERSLGEYRLGKLLLAATHPFDKVKAKSEVLPPPIDPAVSDIVFVLHGIRDIGRWSSRFEEEVGRHQQATGGGKLLFISPRYGYLGMGPFLFESVRQRHVRWFMDEYTEALARYPQVKAEHIRFFGHSNGTYLLADALQRYSSMKVGNVVLAGSVVPTDYDWSCLQDRVGAIRSYAGTHDWVVALFPRVFELWGIKRLGNRLGGGGFHGFKDPRVENVLVSGAHSAFAGHEADIVKFLMTADANARRRADAQTWPGAAAPPSTSPDQRAMAHTQQPETDAADETAWKEGRNWLQKVLGLWPVALAVWLALITVVSYLGVRVVGAAMAPQWPVLLFFALLVVTVLRTV